LFSFLVKNPAKHWCLKYPAIPSTQADVVCLFPDIYISHSSEATQFIYAGIFSDYFVANVSLSENMLKIGQYLLKL